MTETTDSPDDRPEETAGSGPSPVSGSVPLYGSWNEADEATSVLKPHHAPPAPQPDPQPGPPPASSPDPVVATPPPPVVPGPAQPFAPPPPYGTPAAYPEPPAYPAPPAHPAAGSVPDYGTPSPSAKVIHGPQPNLMPEYGSPGYGPAQQSVPVYVPVPAQAPAPVSSSTTVLAVILLVISVLSLFTCLFTFAGLIGMIFAIISLAISRSNPQTSRTLAIVGWSTFGLLSALVMLFLLVGSLGG